MRTTGQQEAASVPTGASSRLPWPETPRAEGMVWAALAVATTFAVLQFLASLAGFAERAPRMSDQVQGLSPAFVRHLLPSAPGPGSLPVGSVQRGVVAEALPEAVSPAG